VYYFPEIALSFSYLFWHNAPLFFSFFFCKIVHISFSSFGLNYAKGDEDKWPKFKKNKRTEENENNLKNLHSTYCGNQKKNDDGEKKK